jgi:S-disulfanyl-L-cysteine oxidoreductase SoxD
MRRKALALVVVHAFVAVSLGAQSGRLNVGRSPSLDEIRERDITVLPDGTGLPIGKGIASDGEIIYRDKCASCHGVNGEGKRPVGQALVGGIGTLGSPNPLKTIGSYWPYATSVWDYIHRAMPYNEPGSLSPDETYAVTAFLLFRNGIIQRDATLTQENLAKVRMPNREGFVPDSRPDVGRTAKTLQSPK